MITNYTELRTAIAQWMHRTDLTAIIPDFIGIVEEKANRYLRTKDNEIYLAPTAIVNNRITIPTDTVAVKSLWLSGYEVPIKAQSLENVLASGTNGLATLYAWQSNEFVLNGTGTVEGVLYEKIPALSDTNPTNWLLTATPSIYLFGALAEANLYTKNAEEATLWKARFDGLLDELNGNSQRDTMNGPLVARAR